MTIDLCRHATAKRLRHPLLACCIIAVLGFGACSTGSSGPGTDDRPAPRGNRTLGIDFGDLTETGDYDDNRILAAGLKATTTTLAIQWNSIETGIRSYTDPGSVLAISNIYYPAYGMKLSLCIRSIDTVAVPLPADIAGTSFDDAGLIDRYTDMLDWVFTQIPAVDLASLYIGNEVDSNALSNPAFWADYKIFVDAVAAHVHTHPTRSGTKVGFIVTAAAAESSLKTDILAAATGADMVGVTYYPLNPDFTMKPPAAADTDFDAVVDAFGSKPIYLQEVGYPTGNANGSSETAQNEFFSRVFLAWDRHSANIPFLNIGRLVDYSHANAESVAAAYGLPGNTAFISYLETLGLRTWSGTGTNKSAVATLQNLLAERGW